MVNGMYPYADENPTTTFPVAPTPPRRTLGRGARIAVTAIVAALLVAAGAGIGLLATGTGGHSHDVAGGAAPAHAGSDHHGGGSAAGDPAKKAWAQQYGEAFSTMANLPDVAAATPEQQAAAADLLARTEAGVASYTDLAAAQAAGFDLETGIAFAEQRRPQLREQMQAVDAGQMPARMPMVHVANKANLREGKILDPAAPEVLMYAYEGANTWMFVGVMYTANEIYPQAPPDPGGPITRWHYHDNLLGQALMMHVFFVPDNDLAHAYALTMEHM